MNRLRRLLQRLLLHNNNSPSSYTMTQFACTNHTATDYDLLRDKTQDDQATNVPFCVNVQLLYVVFNHST